MTRTSVESVFSPRRTRSQTKEAAKESSEPAPVETHSDQSRDSRLPTTTQGCIVTPLASKLTGTITKLSTDDHRLLLKKQSWLKTNDLLIPKGFERHSRIVDATLVFAQEEGGTAVCITSGGLLLTCSHCVAETPEELDSSKPHWLLFKSGGVVKATCVAWDSRRDLALLNVVAAQMDGSACLGENDDILFPFIPISAVQPTKNSRLACIGHPGSEDLEASEPGIQTNYDVLHVSAGRFRGYAQQDLQDNSEIGALMHDCWTYWGHSGAPLVDWNSGNLVGLHSSWDDETGMRRGIPLEAIISFLENNGAMYSDKYL